MYVHMDYVYIYVHIHIQGNTRHQAMDNNNNDVNNTFNIASINSIEAYNNNSYIL